MSLRVENANQRRPTSTIPSTPGVAEHNELPELLDPLHSSSLNPPPTSIKSAIVQSITKREFREAQDQLLFIFPELKEPFQNSPLRDTILPCDVKDVTMTPTIPSMSADRPPLAPPSTPSSRAISGVLWKRRDVFVRQWRPRWFMLYPEQGMLSYYLLTSSYHPPPPSNPNMNTLVPNAIATSNITDFHDTTIAGSSATSTMLSTETPSTSSLPPLRSRTSSWDSVQQVASENTMDYDVVPRGSIYLYNCTVVTNDALSKPNEHMFVFTIHQQSGGTETSANHSIHLAARTEALREEWVAQIHAVCQSIQFSMTAVVGRGTPRRVATEPALRRSSRIATTETMQPRRLELAPPGVSGMADGITDRALCSWTPVDSSASLKRVPQQLAQQIQEKMGKYLPLLSLTVNGGNTDDWKHLPVPGGAVGSAITFSNHQVMQKIDEDSRCAMTRSSATIHHSMIRVFHLLMNITERHKYEVNVAIDDRMQQFNPYTFLDYYAYKPVWPTTAREFTVATHWQVIKQNHDDKRAVLILSFSCPEASLLRPASSQYVRANLIISAYLLRPIKDTGRDYCHFTRILSLNLSGQMNQQLSNMICTQQANLPLLIADYLHRHPSTIDDSEVTVLTPEILESRVIKSLPGTARTGRSSDIAPSPSAHRNGSPVIAASDIRTNLSTKPAIELQFIALMAPVLLHWLLDRFNIAGAGLIFCLSAFFSVRQIVCWYVGRPLQQNDDPSVIGPVTCRFRVDLKGILRFISNKKEERVEMKSNHTEISVVHIVASALALALTREPILHTRKVAIPWLCINRVVDASGEPVAVSVSENGGGIVTLACVEQHNIQEIADMHAAAEKLTDRTNIVGNCLILAMSSYDEGDMVTDAVPFHEGVTVVAVLGGVHLERRDSTQVRNSGSKDPPKPVLSLSLTITGSHQSADIVICRRFADEVRKLLVYPEICENLDSRIVLKR